eukprot:PhF_6_TR29523/c0_g1_i2/m.43708
MKFSISITLLLTAAFLLSATNAQDTPTCLVQTLDGSIDFTSAPYTVCPGLPNNSTLFISWCNTTTPSPNAQCKGTPNAFGWLGTGNTCVGDFGTWMKGMDYDLKVSGVSYEVASSTVSRHLLLKVVVSCDPSGEVGKVTCPTSISQKKNGTVVELTAAFKSKIACGY